MKHKFKKNTETNIIIIKKGWGHGLGAVGDTDSAQVGVSIVDLWEGCGSRARALHGRTLILSLPPH